MISVVIKNNPNCVLHMEPRALFSSFSVLQVENLQSAKGAVPIHRIFLCRMVSGTLPGQEVVEPCALDNIC